jgi:hypothetical protein
MCLYLILITSVQPSAVAAAAPTVGAAASAAARGEMSRAWWARAEANEAFYEVRDNYFGPDRKAKKKQAQAAREAAHAAFAAAAAVWHGTEEAALMRGLRVKAVEAGLLVA